MRLLTKIATDCEAAASDFCEYARMLALNGGSAFDALERHNGTMSPRVETIMKAASAAGTTFDTAWGAAAVDVAIVVGAFVESLRSESLFYRLIADRAIVRAPLRTRLLVSTLDASGWIKLEGAALPVSQLALDGTGITIRHAGAILVMSKELISGSSPAARALFEAELRSAVADAVDREFLAALEDTSTPSFISTGNDADAILQDVRSLLFAVAVDAGNRSRLYWAFSPDAAIRASLHDDGRNQMAAEGGFFYSLPAVVTSALGEGEVALIDAASVAGDSETVEIDASEQASLEIATTPENNSATGSGTSQVSLWQTGSVGLLARARFGARPLRYNAIARLSGVAWGDPEST